MKNLFLTVFALLVSGCFASAAFAGVEGYSGLSSEKLFIESATKLGKETFLVKFEGIESDWSGKVIKTKREKTSRGDRFGFEYDLELSSGIQKRHYNILVEAGKTLKNGTLVRQMDLYTPGSKDPLRLTYDEALTKSSQGVDLATEHGK
ncbi:MAG: hypothetical protein U1E10_18990, partial [Bdellovibrionales bacterium]|nr:hypothetical protein [Bdellovibrionales bacterium]